MATSGTGRRFTIHACLGRGGFGEVYRATMASSGGVKSEVAVKILRADIDPGSEAVKRLRDEGRLLGALRHPSILRVHDLLLLDHRVALVTEYVDGEDLDRCIHGSPPMPPRVLFSVVGEVASALHVAFSSAAPGSDHPMRLVHRDVKPANIRVGKHGEVKLLDFGIARAANVVREAHTANNAMMGSSHYMAPERFHEDDVHPPSDVYALGCILFEGLTGQRLFGDRTLKQIYGTMLSPKKFEEHLEGRLSALGAQPDGVQQAVAALLSPNPEDRPTAGEVARIFEDFAEDTPGPTLKRWSRTRDWPVIPPVQGSLTGRELESQSFVSTRPPTPLPVATPSAGDPLMRGFDPLAVSGLLGGDLVGAFDPLGAPPPRRPVAAPAPPAPAAMAPPVEPAPPVRDEQPEVPEDGLDAPAPGPPASRSPSLEAPLPRAATPQSAPRSSREASARPDEPSLDDAAAMSPPAPAAPPPAAPPPAVAPPPAPLQPTTPAPLAQGSDAASDTFPPLPEPDEAEAPTWDQGLPHETIAPPVDGEETWLGDDPGPAPEPIPGVFDEPLPVFGAGAAADDAFDRELEAIAARRNASVRRAVLGVALLGGLALVGLVFVAMSGVSGDQLGADLPTKAADGGLDVPVPPNQAPPEGDAAAEVPAPGAVEPSEPGPKPVPPKPVVPKPAAPKPAAPKPAAPKPAAPKAGPSAVSLAEQGWNAVSKHPDKAVRLFSRSLEIDPGHADASYGLGYSLLQLKRADEARPHLCRALRSSDTTIQRDVRSLLEQNGLSCQ